MYYQVKLQWLEPKEGGDEMEKKRKSFLVEAVSVTDAEASMVNWIPSNYQDALVKGIDESKLIDIKQDSESEDWWQVKLADENEKGKLVPFYIAINGGNHFDVLKRVDKLYSLSQFLEIKKLTIIIDDDLVKIKKDTGTIISKISINESKEFEESAPF